MIGTHSTIIEGKQIIFLNEVVLENNTAKTKTLSNEFKDLITEPNLFINPKNKPQIIPKGTGDRILLIDISFKTTPAFAKANSGIIPNAT